MEHIEMEVLVVACCFVFRMCYGLDDDAYTY